MSSKDDRAAQDAVTKILEHSELPSDGMLIVHSAFANFSRQGIRVEPFIEALIEAIPDGTLLMPVMTWRTVTITHPYFDESYTCFQ